MLVLAVFGSGSTNLLRAEIYIAAFAGAARTRPATVTLVQSDPASRLTLRNVPFGGRSFESPIYYGYRAGYYLTRHFGVEAEFIHLKIYADLSEPVSIEGNNAGVAVREQAPMSQYAQQFEVSHGLNMVLVNAIARRSLAGSSEPSQARLALVGRLGAGPTIPHPEVIVRGVGSGSYQSGPVAVQAAAGLEGLVWRGLRALLEYKFTFTPTSFSIPDGKASLHVHSQHLITGLAVYF